MQLPYDLRQLKIHNNSLHSLGDTLEIETPPQQWAYAAEFPLNRATLPDGFRLQISLSLRVKSGTIGIGAVLADGTGMHQEVQASAEDGVKIVELFTGPSEQAGSIIIRNVSSRGPSRAEIMLLVASPVQADIGPSPLSANLNFPEVVIDPCILDGFCQWSGIVPAGYWADWTGILTKADVFGFSTEVAQHFQREHTGPDVFFFADDELVLDWAPLVRAVKDSNHLFRMAALGAGWGRWLAAGGALAHQIGKDYHLLGVEAEPQHFAWMQRHMRENGFDPTSYALLEAAATGRPGFVLFEVGDAQTWYGQSIRASADGKKVRRVQAVTIEGILARCSPLDYLHMDIQGAEYDFLSYCPELLDDQVRLINVGTHSSEIEAGVRQLFTNVGWINVFDIELGTRRTVRFGDTVHEVEFGDGVQVWANPKMLVGRPNEQE
jgi:FkbM family methyltransferase